MVSNLYEILGIARDATPEDGESSYDAAESEMTCGTNGFYGNAVRKAYRKKALLTHPDRLPPNSEPQDKKKFEEQFRLVILCCAV